MSKVTLNTESRRISKHESKQTELLTAGSIQCLNLDQVWTNMCLKMSVSFRKETCLFGRSLTNKKATLYVIKKGPTIMPSFPRWFTPHRLSVCLNRSLISYVPHLYWPLCKPVKANAEKRKTAGALHPTSNAIPIKVALLPFLNN